MLDHFFTKIWFGTSNKQSKCAPKWPQDDPEPPKPSPNGAQDPSNSDFWVILGLVLFWLQICMFSLQFCGKICLFFKEPTFKIHAPTQCFVDFHMFGHVFEKISKIVEKSSRNPSQIQEKSKKNQEKSRKMDGKSQDECGKPKNAWKMWKKCEKWPNMAPKPKRISGLDGIRETLSLLRKELKPSVTYENPFK